jgi:amidophosphoribosyltransferase
VSEMADFINADSLAFISVDGLYRALGEEGRDPAQPSHCDACFTGDYPTPLTDHDALTVPDQFALLDERVLA